MAESFLLKQKQQDDVGEKYVVMSLRLERKLQDKFEVLATKCGCSRNKLMCMALQYAMDHLEFVSDEE